MLEYLLQLLKQILFEALCASEFVSSHFRLADVDVAIALVTSNFNSNFVQSVNLNVDWRLSNTDTQIFTRCNELE